MNKKVIIEVCANSVESALAAQEGGASRIELCCNLNEGGTTPSYASIEMARKLLQIELNVLIRPRGGDFLYSDLEYELIKRDIEICKNLGVNGVVIGLLDEQGNIDIPRNKELIRLARPMSITFHRAFDMSNDPLTALAELINMGVDRVLTSGQKDKVTQGLPLVKKLVELSEGKIIIMPGGGISSANISRIVQETNATEFHLTGKKTVQSKMIFKNAGLSMGDNPDIPEYANIVTDAEEIKRVVSFVTPNA